jgi:ubiquinone/menaquinone biosynthesis C-methylase UbiE
MSTLSSAAQTARVAALFDALAASYDTTGVDFFQPIAAGLLAALPPRPGERWLDLGCGRGAVLVPAAAAVGASGEAVGVDLSPAMVAQARALAAQQGLHRVQVRVDDAQAPSREGAPFDVVASSLVLFFLPDPVAALAAWLPLLRPGGRLGVTTFGRVDPRWERVDAVFEPFLSPSMRDARTSGRRGPFASDAGLEALVEAAGFTEVRTVTGSLAVRFADAAQWHAFTWSTAQRAMWLAVPDAERPRVRAEAERRLLEASRPDGSIVFEQGLRHTLAVRPR